MREVDVSLIVSVVDTIVTFSRSFQVVDDNLVSNVVRMTLAFERGTSFVWTPSSIPTTYNQQLRLAKPFSAIRILEGTDRRRPVEVLGHDGRLAIDHTADLNYEIFRATGGVFGIEERLQQSSSWEKYQNTHVWVEDGYPFAEEHPVRYEGKTFTVITRNGAHHTRALFAPGGWGIDTRWLSPNIGWFPHEVVLAWRQEPS